MTVYDIPNIEHCTVTPVSNMFRIVSDEGWYIHLNNGVVGNENIWKTAVILLSTYDWSKVEIRAEVDLPEGAEICGSGNSSEII